MTQIRSEGEISWQSPSNIAIIKYWGKHGIQLPENPSFSFTLSAAYTRTKVHYRLNNDEVPRSIRVSLDKMNQPGFVPKIGLFLDRISDHYPFVQHINLKIETHNSFPHSSGIASSASAMSALALIIAEISGNSEDLKEISRIARLGSGSASRSVFPYGSVWGSTDAVSGSSDEYAVGMESQMHPVFQSFRDAILIVKSGKKTVSSSAGHGLMAKHPYAKARYQLAHQRMQQLIPALQNGDIETFGQICEKEALELHALMMCSDPPYMLLEPATIDIIQRIYLFRSETKIPAYFTLDAGPNIHLLYPKEYQQVVKDYIENELIDFCENGKWIDDAVGSGPVKIEIK